MKDIRSRISQKRILFEYDIALNKKEELMMVDTSLYNKLQEFIEETTNDIRLNQLKIIFLENKLSSYPAPADRAGMLLYSWNEISEIQSVLLTPETSKV
jgi:hypothetical protein